ncbi:uncharacterized protein N7459_004308 [Penicillium hispanicum]|uniref:uncharacterized protein n=1 Tax=Penicillium hispanicum TaxID=1080232 RepID=UPI00253FB81B|nr:uncharacterized protein N7459_004308 [Penicillium hispanicum]KAJ5584508.1 hypothetical protein N7459_004308 [Penicillium hispanicum]
MSLLTLPNELLLDIMDMLGDDESSINNLAQTNSHLFFLLNDRLYSHNAACHESSALLWGVHRDNAQTVLRSIRRGANLNTQSKDRQTPLVLAALANRGHFISFLVDKGANPNIADMWGNTVLSLTVKKGDLGCVQFLLDHGAAPNFVLHNGEGPLHTPGISEQMARLLLVKGADPNQADELDITPLQLATMRGSVEIAQLLLEFHAHPSPQDSKGLTPLFYAITRRHVAIARLLLEAGADPDTRNHRGETALIHAASMGLDKETSLLLSHAADVNAACRWNETALHRAAERGDIEVALHLLKAGASVDMVDAGMETAFRRAVSMSKGHMARLLLTWDTDVKYRRYFARRPFHRWGEARPAELLMARGVNPQRVVTQFSHLD